MVFLSMKAAQAEARKNCNSNVAQECPASANCTIKLPRRSSLVRSFTLMNKYLYSFNKNGATITKPSAIALVSMPVMRMVMVFMRFMSTRWKASGLCSDLGSDRIAGFLRRNYPCIWASLSLFTMPVSVARHFFLPFSPVSFPSSLESIKSHLNCGVLSPECDSTWR
jgi:hypothetical protein